MNGMIDGLFDFLQEFFRSDKVTLIVGFFFAAASAHYTLKFLNESSESAYAVDGMMNLMLSIALVLASNAMIKLVFSPSFGATLGDFLQESSGATGVGGVLRGVAVTGLLLGITGFTAMVLGFDWYTTSRALGTNAYPLLDIRQAPAVLCVFAPSGSIALTGIQQRMRMLSSKNTGASRGSTKLP